MTKTAMPTSLWLFLLACSEQTAAESAPLPPTLAPAADLPSFAAEPATAFLPGCVARVDDLPASAVLQADDVRLRGDRVVVVLKERRRLLLFDQGVLRTGDRQDGLASCWRVALGVNNDGIYPPGAKQVRGDRKTPEGWYRTSDKPTSSFYAAIAVHYPNTADAHRGLAAELIVQSQHDQIVQALRAGRKPLQETRLGGEILIHGGGSSMDWTLGCIALENDDIDALRATLPAGMKTDVLILP